MGRTEPTWRTADSSEDIDDWMAERWAAVARLSADAEATGREAWRQLTRNGRRVKAARPRDVNILGDRSRRGDLTRGAAIRTVVAEPDALQELDAPMERAAGADLANPQRMDLGLTFRTARSGDSITKLVGSSDPRAIGKFLSLNGMDGPDSTLRSGRSYVVPTRWDDATTGETKIGERVLGVDNARRNARAEQDAAIARQSRLFEQGRNIWTGELIDTSPRARTSRDYAVKRSSLDDNPTAKAAVGTLGWGLGLAPGAVRGGVDTVKGAVDAATFIQRLTNPFDIVLSPPGRSASQQLVDTGLRFGDYLRRGAKDPSIVEDDIGAALHDFRLQQDPFATRAAPTLSDEFRRTFNIGMNNGEAAFDVGSLFLGGEFLRGAAGLGSVAKAATPAEYAFLAEYPGIAARFDLPYTGMSHHIISRSARLPAFLGAGLYPKWLIDSDFNKIRYRGMTTRDVYRNHVGVDGDYRGGKVGAKYGGARWSAKDLGWTEYGPLDRLNYGTSPYTKAVVGPFLVGGTLTDWTNDEDHR